MNLPALLEYTVTGSPAQVKKATEELLKLENSPNFSVSLLEIVHNAASSDSLKLATALYFKNLIAKRWPPGSDVPIPEEEKNKLKSFIIQLMVTTRRNIQKQLTEALTIMSVHDFPQKWNSLIPDLIAQLNVSQSVDFNRIVGTLRTLNSIVYRFRNAPNTDEVNSELKIILDDLAAPLLAFFQTVEAAIAPNENNKETLPLIINCLLLLSRIFYSLNFVDIPYHFEDTLPQWMPLFQKLLNYNTNNILLLCHGDDEDKAGPLVKLKIAIIEIIRLYVEKYETQIQDYVNRFIGDIWGLLQVSYDHERYNRLISVGINFLTIVCQSIFYQIFNQPDALLQICHKVIIPNMVLRESDQDNFENDPVEYIRADIEGSDTDTRRKCAYNLVKGLRKHYQQEVTSLFGSYITTHLDSYNQNKSNWASKNVSIYLVMALTISGETADRGTTRINEFIPLLDFYKSHILPELISYPENHAIIQSDSLKFITSFRNILPEAEIANAFGYVVKMLGSKEYVVATYAANAVERFLYSQKVSKEHLNAALQELYDSIFKQLSNSDCKDNEYLVKCIMRITSVAGADILRFANVIFQQLLAILQRIIDKPSNPEFNHYVFESLAAFLKSIYSPGQDYISPLEPILLPIFQTILEKEITAFTPYVFQLMAQMTTYSPSFTQNHLAILNQIVMPVMWESTGNIPALVRLLRAMIGKGYPLILQNRKLEPILGVFQKLLSSSVTDFHAFKLLEPLIDFIPFEQFKPFIPEIFKLFFIRIQKNKTNSFLVNFMACVSRMILRYQDPTVVFALFESVQPNISKDVITTLWMPHFTHIYSAVDKKIIFNASARLLFSPVMQSPLLASFGRTFYTKLVEGVEAKKVSQLHLYRAAHQQNEEDINDDFEQFKVIKTSFVRLVNASPKEEDPFPDITFEASQFAAFLKSKSSDVENIFK